MRKKAISMILTISCLMTGCDIEENNKDAVQRTEYQLEMQSSCYSEDCFICGEYRRNLLPYDEKRDSIGIIHWNSGTIVDSEVRTYDEEGNEIFLQDNNMKTKCFGDKGGTIMINPIENRGISEVMVTYTNEDEIDFELLKQKLCQDCLEQVVQFYVDQRNFGEESHLATTGYSLVDFQTKRLYTLSDPYSTYFIRDYHVNYEIQEDKGVGGDRIDLLLFYAPERVSAGSM